MRIRQTAIAGTFSLCMSIVVAGCAKSPNREHRCSARCARGCGRSSDAAKYAPDALQSAQNSWGSAAARARCAVHQVGEALRACAGVTDEARASAEREERRSCRTHAARRRRATAQARGGRARRIRASAFASRRRCVHQRRSRMSRLFMPPRSPATLALVVSFR